MINPLSPLPAAPAHLLVLLLASLLGAVGVSALDVGVARMDVTPTEPIRLTGYASRKKPSEGVEQKLWAKALAIGSDREAPAVLLTLDNCGIAEATWREVRTRLSTSARLKSANLVIASSHTHSAPATKDWAPNIFVQDLPPEQLAAIDRYTAELVGKLEQVALEALKHRQPGKLSWSQGTVTFAKNRRTVRSNTAGAGGGNDSAPVDQALPVLKAESADGKLLALVANYACHCTTLGGEFNHVCADWAGFAQAAVERDNPGAVALITIGCGADANPAPRGGADFGLALAKQHGDELAAEVKRLLSLNFTPLTGKLATHAKEIALPFAPHFSREQWLARSTNSGIVGFHAKKWLARLDRGEKLPDSLYYPITTWNFGDELALVFLPGEVVVDYSLRLKRELDSQRLWVSSYANYVPCYIPSRRILAEGGYEAEDSLWYYDRPARISTNAEDLIIRSVEGLVPKAFHTDPKRAERPGPKTPEQALGAFRTKAELKIELVASEPLIESPVAIDWDAKGRLWVCEMYDYPSGMNPRDDPARKFGELVPEPPGGFNPGGRIKILTDTNGDGRFDKATLFLDRIPFPTGVMPWRKGALICAAPNILYAEDTDGDGRADVVRTNVTGFATHNFQARVNGFTWGLDGWLHGSSGLFGGKVKSLQTGKEIDLSGRDFRYQPETGEIEPVSGISQYGRVRDDFDNWFGNDNSTLLYHYPLPDHYLRRNPYVNYPEPRVLVARGGDANKVFPISRTLERFNHPESANILTSACGPDIYRDVLLGSNYYGNAFICEPVHNLVRRLVLNPDGVSFAGRRADNEQRSEFLSSSDNWFRPVQVRTGPDGALYVVDMYRFVIEHPRWIPPERRQGLDLRAGANLGRIYRVVPRGVNLRPLQDLSRLTEGGLANALNTPNGPTRDRVHQLVLDLEPGNQRLISQLLLRPNQNAPVKAQVNRLIQTLTTKGYRVPLTEDIADRDSRVRRQAVCLFESLLTNGPSVGRMLLRMAGGLTNEIQIYSTGARPRLEENSLVQLQLAFSLGEWKNPQAAEGLAILAQKGERWLRAAVLSSAVPHVEQLLKATRDWPAATPGRAEFVGQLCRVAVGDGDPTRVESTLAAIAPDDANETSWFEPLAALLDAASARSLDIEALLADSAAGKRTSIAFQAARLQVTKSTANELIQERSVRLLARRAGDVATDVPILCRLFATTTITRVQSAALDRLRSVRNREVAVDLIAQWPRLAPGLRGRVVSFLMAREDWTRELLGATRQGSVAITEISPADQQRLSKHSAADIREQAATLFKRRDSRAAVIAKFEATASLKGLADHGAEIFEKNCAQCHALRGRGHDVGPNLAEFAGKSVQDFLLAVLDPNAGINPNFITYNVELKDGRSLTGIVRNETASGLTLVQGGGARETILRSEIATLKASAISMMPEGLEQAMSPQDMADLIAWLKASALAQFGGASAEQAAAARAEFTRNTASTPPEVVTCVERLPYPSWMGRLPLAYCRQSAGQERLVWKAPPSSATGGRATFRFPAAMGFISEPQGKFTLKLNGRSVLDFDATLTDATWESADGKLRMSYNVQETNSEDSNGILSIEVAKAWLAADGTAEFEALGSPSRSQRWFGIYLIGEPVTARR